MMDQIFLLDLPVAQPMPLFSDQSVFYLNTCQRNLFVGKNLKYKNAKLLQGKEAYQYLLETICGLKSRLIAENEIVSQFKACYKSYLERPERDSDIIRLIEKLFHDAKKIRADYLMKIGQCSYAGLSKRILSQESTDKKVLILGSGAMAIDLIKVLQKRFEIFISARNGEAVEEICQKYQIKPITWGDHQNYFQFYNIINTIGTNKKLFKHQFFLHWCTQKRLFIDVGTPSGLETDLGIKDGIYKLEDIFQKGIELGQKKSLQIEKSRQAIHALAIKRHQYFSKENKVGQLL